MLFKFNLSLLHLLKISGINKNKKQFAKSAELGYLIALGRVAEWQTLGT